MIGKILFNIFGLLLFSATLFSQTYNVLYISVDDLKPNLGCYGDALAISPNIDALASQGTLFSNNHCQQAVCGPSRASILTGKRPDYTRVYDLATLMRDMNPDILTMPQYFKQNNYRTTAIGKVFDIRNVDAGHDEASWTDSYAESNLLTYPSEYGTPKLGHYQSVESKIIIDSLKTEANQNGITTYPAITQYITARFKPSTEAPIVPDEALEDGQITQNALAYLEDYANGTQPFFLCVGYKKPHLPFVAPKVYWDLYDPEELPLAVYQAPVINGYDIAYHFSNELRLQYTDIPESIGSLDIFNQKIEEDKQRQLIHGYYASMSFIDAQVGQLLQKLDDLGLRQNTIVVLTSDHGWHLGDHALWCKHSNFEQATKTPLIISIPNQTPGVNHSPVELIDIFPTICEATNVDVPPSLDGQSLLPAVVNPQAKIKDYAVSQYPRDDKMGYSIRNERYRLTVWMDGGYTTNQAFDESLIYAIELYDNQEDPLETINIYGLMGHDEESQLMLEYFASFVGVDISTNPNDLYLDSQIIIPSYFNPNEVGFRPNLNVLLKDYSLSIFDIQGKLIFNTTDEQQSWNGQLNNRGGFAPSGTYVCRVLGYDKKQRLIKKSGKFVLLNN